MPGDSIDYQRLAAMIAAEVQRRLDGGTTAPADRGALAPLRVEDREFHLVASVAAPARGAPLVIALVLERQSSAAEACGLLIDEFGLTRREAGVAILLRRGLSNAAIAAELGLSAHTVKHHVERVLAKLKVSTRAEVTALLTGGIARTSAGRPSVRPRDPRS